jgi:poly(hydroxyalkanoate) depolymerase family esterase
MMKKFAMPIRTLVKLFSVGTAKQRRGILSPLKLVPAKKLKKIYPVKFKAPPAKKLKPIPAKRFISTLISQFAATATAINKTRTAKSPVADSWPYCDTRGTRDTTKSIAPVTQGEFLTKSYTNLAGTLTYKLYVPSDVFSELRPLIVMLHGCTQSPDDFSSGTGMNSIAEQQKCYVAYPAQSLIANRHGCWNWFKKGNQLRGKGEPSLIAGITQQVILDFSIDSSRVYIAGLSAGGAMASTMSHLYPDLYAAVGIHSGLPHAAATNLPSALSAMRTGIYAPDFDIFKLESSSVRPIIVFHGDQDRTVNPANGDQLIARSINKNNNSSQRLGKVPQGHHYSITSYTNDQGQSVAEYWRVHGGGHAWAGGKISGSYTDPSGPDASREMIRFFLSRQLKGSD